LYSAINRDVALRPGSNIKPKRFLSSRRKCYNWCLRRASVLGGSNCMAYVYSCTIALLVSHALWQ